MSNVSRRAVLSSGAALVASMPLPGSAAAAPEAGNRVALNGYDPVSYFTKGRPQKGSAEFTASFDGATYWFGSGDHRALFVADPDRYAPQFHGWCAMSLTRGEIVEADPEAWVIADGKLYVFGKKIASKLFAEQRTKQIETAAKNWREIQKTQ